MTTQSGKFDRFEIRSRSPDGKEHYSYPIGDHPKLRGYELLHPDVPLALTPSIFVVFDGEEHEGGMVSLERPAGFTIVASDEAVGVTRRDAVEQLKTIVKLMIAHPEVFEMRDWSVYDHLCVCGVFPGEFGAFSAFICPAFGDPDNPYVPSTRM